MLEYTVKSSEENEQNDFVFAKMISRQKQKFIFQAEELKYLLANAFGDKENRMKIGSKKTKWKNTRLKNTEKERYVFDEKSGTMPAVAHA